MKYDRHGHLYGNFMQYEVAKSNTAARLELDNTPPDTVLDAARLLAEHCLQPIREHFKIPFTPQSWYRCEALEFALCKKAYIQWLKNHGRQGLSYIDDKDWQDYLALKSHPKGEAADVELIGVSNDALFAWCRANLQYDQLIREFAVKGDPMSGWVHISYRATGNRGQVFDIK